MEFILVDWVKYYTKGVFKTLKLVTIGSAIVVTVVLIKYKPVYRVTISGETIGFIANKELTSAKVEKYVNDNSGNIAFREISEMPEYELKLINKNKKTDEEDVMLAVRENTKTTYKFYAINSDGDQRAIMSSQNDAENVINDVKTGLNPKIDLKLGIVEIYTEEYKVNSIEEARNSLNEVKGAREFEYAEEEKAKAEKARQEAIKLAKARSASYSRNIAVAGDVAPTGALNGLALSIPVSGSISSRFGERSSIRSSIHTGLDIASSSGNGIRATTTGTVTFAGYKGSYGNLIIVNHGGGVETYYAHCSAIYVSSGQAVGPGTTIGAVGATGNATGPHLHFEIRINGTPVNPQNYLY